MSKTLMCDPALFEKDLSGRVYIVTGANSGIGLCATRQLAQQGATVVAACRRPDAGEEAFAGVEHVEVMQLDLGSLDSVRAFAKAFLEKHDRLDGLNNNAGVMGTPAGKTKDGFETQIGVNHLGHFLLTELLLDVLKKTAAEHGDARVVNVSSCFHVDARGQAGELHLEDLNFEKRDYDPWSSYAQSKLANVVHAKELARRLEGTGVTAVSLHPGWVRTNLIAGSGTPAWVQNVVMRPLSGLIGSISAEDGAQTSLHCLLDDDVPKHNGAYYSQKGIYPEAEDKKGGWPLRSPNPQANDDALAEALYDKSRELVGLSA